MLPALPRSLARWTPALLGERSFTARLAIANPTLSLRARDLSLLVSPAQTRRALRFELSRPPMPQTRIGFRQPDQREPLRTPPTRVLHGNHLTTDRGKPAHSNCVILRDPQATTRRAVMPTRRRIRGDTRKPYTQ